MSHSHLNSAKALNSRKRGISAPREGVTDSGTGHALVHGMTTTNAAYHGKIKWRITSGGADSLYIHAEIGDGPRAYDVAQAMAAAAARIITLRAS
jgi:hypothetical protein